MKHPYMNYRNLEDVLQAVGGPTRLLRSSNIGPYVFPVVSPEYTNWREEQRAWRESVALLNLSYHMTSLYIKGPDALKLLQHAGCNKLQEFPLNRGKQIIFAGHDGNLICDSICYHTSDDVYRVVGSPVGPDWLQFHAESGAWDVEIERDETITYRGGDPLIYAYQVQGPNAQALVEEVSDGTLPDIKFFHIGEFKIRGRSVRALRHGMSGAPGFEIIGPWADAAFIMEALEETGEKYGLRKVGSVAYPTSAVESAWMALPLPAIYHSEEMKPYRQWLTPNHLEVLGSLGGSLVSDDIRDYYVDPVEVGYARFLDLNNDCIGRDALVEKLQNQRRKKVALVWNADDVSRVNKSALFSKSDRAKFINQPLSVYSTFQFDQVLHNGNPAGMSTYGGFNINANVALSTGIIDLEYADIGTELTLCWGEPNSQRRTVEDHVMSEIRVTVAQAPLLEKLNKNYK